MVGQLILLICGAALAAIAFGLLVKRENGRVHTPLFMKMLEACKNLGMNDIQILTSEGARPGYVYILEKRLISDSFHLQGVAMDVAMTGAQADRFLEYVYHYSWEIRSKRMHVQAVIRNLTDA